MSSLTLLIGSTVAVLFVSAVATVALLYNEGSRALPGTLASIAPPS